ncbi:MAG TPA: cbb3-type cytochrome oxidase assembly protein CcoS [Xanthobacteraceae bacterium]|nr:cbb3-type cytochrome oxidase assembly protein CcoS [Rhizobiaceae bacterium]HWW48949.1 cbb3-type cytochrome oxidase assembly protein CcoS [Xanthobacteraceae bacterium]
MSILWLLIPISFLSGAVGLALFFWALRSGQYEDVAGAAERILDDEDQPL